METELTAVQTLLIIDDDLLVLEALATILQREDRHILKASTGQEGIELLKNGEISLILCDYHLPGMSGLDVLKQAITLQPDAVRIALTGGGDLQEIAPLINEGHIAQFILKPWDNEILLKTIQNTLEKHNLVIENKRLHEEIAISHSHLQSDLTMGGRVQSVLLDGHIPPELPGLQVKGITIPSKVIDGDFYDLFQVSDHLVDVIIGDVMGKGLPAALVGTAVKSQLTRFALPLPKRLSYERNRGWHEDPLDPSEILSYVHREINSPLMRLEYFVSLFYGRFDLEHHHLHFVDCGSSKPLHYQAKTGKAIPVKGENFPLGIIEQESYRLKSTSFSKNDLFIFYSDGVTEARSIDGELFGLDRLTQIIESHSEENPEELTQRVCRSVKEFIQNQPLADDFTLLIFKIAAHKQMAPLVLRNTTKLKSDLAYLKAARNFVSSFCEQISTLSSSEIHYLQLAVDEIFCNIVKHGYRGLESGEVVLQGRIDQETLIFEIKDQGVAFDPTVIEDPSFVGDQEGGFGLFLVKVVTDKITYAPKTHERGWNSLQMMKKLNQREDKMELTHEVKGELLIIRIEEENLDAKAAPLFKKQVTDLVNESHIHRVILDLSKLNFIDSTGLGSFLSILRMLNGAHGDLKLCHMSRPIRTIFELVCMHKIFEIYNTVEEAIRSFKITVSKGRE